MVRIAIGLALALISGFLLIRVVDLKTTADALGAADPLFISLAVFCLVLSVLAKAIRWRTLLAAHTPVSTFRLFRILNVSYLLNNILPMRLGDVARVAATARQPTVRVGHVLSSMVTERVLDALVLVFVFVLISPLLPRSSTNEQWLFIAWMAIGTTAVIVAVSYLLFARFRTRLLNLRIWDPIRLRATLAEEVTSFGEGLARLLSRKDAYRVWGWSLVAWVLAFALNYMVLRSLDIHAPWTVAVLLTCTTNLVMLLPSSPGYIGVYHAAATLTLLPFGVGAGTALSFAILAHLANVIPVSLLGAVFLLAEPRSISLKRPAAPGVDTKEAA